MWSMELSIEHSFVASRGLPYAKAGRLPESDKEAFWAHGSAQFRPDFQVLHRESIRIYASLSQLSPWQAQRLSKVDASTEVRHVAIHSDI